VATTIPLLHLLFIKYYNEFDADLYQDVVQQLQLLDNEFKAKCRDYDNERTFRHHWQEKAETTERDLMSLQGSIESNSHIQVLIDGDAAYFHDVFIQAGAAGASEAAHKLLSDIKAHVQKLNIGSELPIFVHVYANVGGLSGKLTQMGLINSPTDLYVRMPADLALPSKPSTLGNKGHVLCNGIACQRYRGYSDEK
jgi:hypothetical protein